MSRIIYRIILTFLYTVIVFLALRMVFMVAYSSTIGLSGLTDVWGASIHGIAMDMSIAGYLTVLPALLSTASLWDRTKVSRAVMRIYLWVISLLISATYILDLVLYGYWDFRLDTTPIFYFTTSPSSAMASATIPMIVCGCLSMAVLTILIRLGYGVICRSTAMAASRSVKVTIVGTLLTALLFLPIRGSLTVSTMNPSRAYFSSNMRLNHAAVNPMFSLMYSLTHQAKYDGRYRFMSDAEATRLLARLNTHTADITRTDYALDSLLSCRRPDIYLVILESFSSQLLLSAGGTDVASGLDSIAREGVLFPNIFASSFRTDRALPAILSALPAQPSTSVLKYVDKIEHLPSLPKALTDAGYKATYYYGGDANFTNMNAYLVSLGFNRIVSDKDFPLASKTSKWGAHDHELFAKVLSEKTQYDPSSPQLKVIQTSSSHEPFKVPYSAPRFADDERLNAFAYTDRCLTSFINGLSRSTGWDSTLIVILPDHWGVWPIDLTEMAPRHRIPLIMTGGALNVRSKKDERIGQQVDVAATLLAMLGIDAGERFPFSRNLFDKTTPEFAFFSRPSAVTLLTPGDTVTIDCETFSPALPLTSSCDSTAVMAAAYLQHLYRYLSEL